MQSGGVVAHLARPPGNLNATTLSATTTGIYTFTYLNKMGFYVENGESGAYIW
jgi:hypothetical protein